VNRFRKLVVVTAVGASVLTASATPATALEAAPCRLGPWGGGSITYVIEDVGNCACVVAGTVANIVFPDSWACA
jgi:hypothetical protein